MSLGLSAVEPLSDHEFAGLMQAFYPDGSERPTTIAIGVSGGADSMALSLLAHEWAKTNGVTAIAVTVDHSLRPESADEARQVGLWLKARGIDHHILTLNWDQKPETRIQERARQMRYDMLGAWCKAHGTNQVLIAHHQEDQAETVLMRLRKGSGLIGLAGMRHSFDRAGLLIYRPLLTVAKERLLETLEVRNQDWVEDPSNFNMAFERVRTRELLKHLAREGVDAQRLADTAEALGKLRDVLETAAEPLISNPLVSAPITLDRAKLSAAEPLILSLALAKLLKQVGGQPYAPDQDKLDRLTHWVRSENATSARTLAGCELRRTSGQGRDVLTIQPEGPRSAVKKAQDQGQESA